MDEFDKIMSLIAVFGAGLTAFMAYGSRRLDHLEAARRKLEADKGDLECSADTRV